MWVSLVFYTACLVPLISLGVGDYFSKKCMLFVENLGKGFEKVVYKGETQKAIKHWKRYSKSLVIREVQSKSLMIHYVWHFRELGYATCFQDCGEVPSCVANRFTYHFGEPFGTLVQIRATHTPRPSSYALGAV